jgi:hypothetical protein
VTPAGGVEVEFVTRVAFLLGVMSLIFVWPIFVVSAISQWWDVRRFRGVLARMQSLPLDPPDGAD